LKRSINGLDLCEAFFRDAIRPILCSDFPNLQYSAALLGDGSEVLGFDTEMSRDHDWGPRGMLFLEDSTCAKYAASIDLALRKKLPKSFQGYSTGFTDPQENQNGTQQLQLAEEPTVNHHIEILTPQKFLRQHIEFDIDGNLDGHIEVADWLTFSEQKLATIIGGRIFEDQIGLQSIRDRFAYYPHDIWLYLLGCAWTRIEQEEHLMGRAGFVGDELGSAIIAARLVRDLMRLCFLMEKRYAPYPKWYGTTFLRLKAAPILAPLVQHIISANSWEERQKPLSKVYETVAVLHNELAITKEMPTKVRNFHERPFLVISMGTFSKAILAQIQDPNVLKVAQKHPIGSIDQFSDSTDLLSNASWRPKLRTLYID
jgi:Domain of unknown function (DUF4037)